MSLKVIVFDIDGTLVNKESPYVDESIIHAVRQAQSQGIKVCLATGRPMHLIDQHIIDALLPDGYVTLNGQCCLNKDFEIIHNVSLDHATLHDFKVYAQNHHLEFALHSHNDTLFNQKGVLYEVIYTMLGKDHGKIVDIDTMPWDRIIYTLIVYSPEKGLIDTFINQHPHLRYDEFKPQCVDIFNKDANKAFGIEKLLKQWNVEWDNVLAFGDNTNDIEMLHHSAWGVVVEGGPQVMKSLDFERIEFFPRANMSKVIFDKMR